MTIKVVNIEEEVLEEYANIFYFLKHYFLFYKYKKYGKDYKLVFSKKNWTKHCIRRK